MEISVQNLPSSAHEFGPSIPGSPILIPKFDFSLPAMHFLTVRNKCTLKNRQFISQFTQIRPKK
jgi:hypothetical protein